MSAGDYRARADTLDGSADALADSADRAGDYELIVELRAAAEDWRRLAEMADRQDEVLATQAKRSEQATPGLAVASGKPEDL